MANLEEKLAAEILLERARKLLKGADAGKTKKDLETERLFYWILNVMARMMEEASTPQRDYRLCIEERKTYGINGEIFLFGDTGDEYRFKYVYGKDVNDVITRVECMLNSIYGYSVEFIQQHSRKQKALIRVAMSI